ncbi:MAG: bifunctional phosphopantothenoylcysteine decarboxylase/phosphopantothenate--cysteine ligase CoaBC [Myxococcota bacterium]
MTYFAPVGMISVMKLIGKTVILGVSGGIAAYKSAYLARLFVKGGAKVYVVMTPSAEKLVAAATFQALTGNHVYTETFDPVPANAMGHIELAQAADLLVIAPATANTIAKFACGIADNLLTTLSIATKAPILVCPAMNVNMWRNEVTQENLKKLLKRKQFRIVEPEEGELACGDEGAGRMAEPERIFASAKRILSPNDLAGVRILVTAGATREPIDIARFISNYSTGKMGYLIAEEAFCRGAQVTLVSGATQFPPPLCNSFIAVESAKEMFEAVKSESGKSDVIIMSAAVSDFTPAKPHKGKLKKDEGVPEIKLAPTQDILKWLSENAKQKIRVGFAAEHERVIEFGLDKLKRKKCHILVANEVGKPCTGFASDTDRAAILIEGKPPPPLKLYSKADLAKELLNLIAEIAAKKDKKK